MENVMDTVESLYGELEAWVADMDASGLDEMDPRKIEKLDSYAAAAESLGLNTGKKLLENLSAVLKSFKEGSAKENSVMVRFTALDFYLQHIKGGGTEETLSPQA
jgi:hypothetical protein